jgi:hypothetical protein
MARIVRPSPVCPEHGKPTKRADCRECNAAYMRDYLWRRCQARPDWALWLRAKKRAADRGLRFDLAATEIIIPPTCPALGIPLRVGKRRSPNSPSLDRIEPWRGYVSGNVRVISDRANRLKGARDLQQLRASAARASGPLQTEFLLLAEYVEREALLREVRAKAEKGRPGWREWAKIAVFLDKVFSRGQLLGAEYSKVSNKVSDLLQRPCHEKTARSA